MSDRVPRRSGGGRRYAMGYIPDKTLFKAVTFALKLMREGMRPAVAHTRAAGYYGVAVSDVAHYTGQAGGTRSHRRAHGG